MSTALFENIANDLRTHGFSIQPDALPMSLSAALFEQQKTLTDQSFQSAGVGRGGDRTNDEQIRSDRIAWINGAPEAEKAWLDWTNTLQRFLNQRLFLGLFSYESHFAHYAPGQFYKRHVDAFRGNTNRVVSTVTYLNPEWHEQDGGELVLYQNDEDQEGIRVLPKQGTLVSFLSEEFPHEVLPAHKDRYSIAGWFRINSSGSARVDPPR